MNIFDVCKLYYFDRCLIFAGTSIDVNAYSLVDIGDPTRLLLFFCRGYGFVTVIPAVYLSIAIGVKLYSFWHGMDVVLGQPQ